MSDRPITGTVYLVMQKRYAWRGCALHVEKVLQNKPTGSLRNRVVVKLALSIPAEAFAPNVLEATVDVPYDHLLRGEIEAESVEIPDDDIEPVDDDQ